MKIATFLISSVLLWFFVASCRQQTNPEPTIPTEEISEEISEEPEAKDTIAVEKPKVDTILYDTSWVSIAKGFEELLIKRQLINDNVNDGKVRYSEVKDIDSINLAAQSFDHYRFTSIKGIEYFKNLRYLNVFGSYLDSLDL
jgi:hypothetical protein